MLFKCFMWREQGLVISPNHILLLGRSQLNLHLYQPVHCHPPLPHHLLGNWVSAHLHLTRTPCNLTVLRIHMHVFPWHILKREGGENMQGCGEATQDSTNL